jgi:hypothetical protein
MRDQMVVLSSDAVIVCGMSAGTAAEVSLAIKARKPVVLVRPDGEVRAFFERLGNGALQTAETAEEAVGIVSGKVPGRRS